MTFTDYVLNAAIIALVLFQIRGRRLGPRTLILPITVVAVVAASYLRAIPTAGGDLPLILAGAGAGLVLGAACGLATAVYRRPDGVVMAKAGPVAAALWVAGVGARLAFALYATHGGARAIGDFSVAHHITSGQAWVDCLVLMALVEVLSRSAVLAAKFMSTGARWFGASQATVAATIMTNRGN
ncbi:MAG: hypothetical protein M0030_27060 [Actinomycetota bacterium]|nr:hypothetical protein [Actinomycetota bacterium]